MNLLLFRLLLKALRVGHSNGTTMAGAMLDALPNPKNPATSPGQPLPWMNGVAYDAPPIENATRAKNPQLLAAARNLWAGLDEAAWKKGGQGVQRTGRLQALRAAIVASASPSLGANWRWNLQLWDESDRTTWNETMKRAFPWSKQGIAARKEGAGLEVQRPLFFGATTPPAPQKVPVRLPAPAAC